jgi:hypothetical protein
MTCGLAIPPSATCWRVCAKAVLNLQGWWEAHDVSGVAAGRKSLIHPKKGRLKLEYASFQANDDPALKLVIYIKV